ncbi:MAG: prolipoprotein diacylglyceryl transferase [Thermomicrobium sp.]|nr:prolipoprotein diacylglyceryl transferase [Thermomicrobium sp.]
MFTVTIGMDPDIARIGPLLLTWHGLFTAVAILAAVWLAGREIARKGIAIPNFDLAVLLTILGGVVGARLFFVLDHLGEYLREPWRILAITEGGLAVYGGIIGGTLTAAFILWRQRVPIGPVADAVAPALLLAQGIGRFGCLVNGDAWGGPCTCLACAGAGPAVPTQELGYCPFALRYTNPKALLPADLLGVPTHPYPIYDMAVNFLVLAILWRLRRRGLPDGSLFALYWLLYGIGRFLISFVRQEAVWFWGLQQAQVVALVTALVGALALAWLLRRRTPLTAPVGS